MNRGLTFFLLAVLLSCDKDSRVRNPFLQEIGFRFDINLNLPLYSPLTNQGNSIYVGTQGVGTRGVFVANTGFDQLRAFEASCPNHAPNECSTMTLNGILATCSCDDYEYFVINGQMKDRPDDGRRYYDMLEYRATQSGSVVVISN